MKINYLFSRRDKWGSKLIAWGSSFESSELKDIPSHAALLINNKMVVESVLGRGVRIAPYDKWKEINEELYNIPCEQADRPSDSIISEVMDLWGKPYDWRGILYFAYCYARLILLDEELPKVNKWERKSHLFCIELVGRVSNTYYSMTSPAKMCAQLLGKI